MNLRRAAIMRSVFGMTICAAALFISGVTRAAPVGDATKGNDVFDQECSDCHSVKQGKNKKGPSLFGVVGRNSASIADFAYSDPMRALNTVWSVEKIDEYITKPKQVVPGGKMKYDGLADAQARADVNAYLAEQK